MIKKTEQPGFNGTVATIQNLWEGAAQPVTYSLVNGFQSFNNNLFSISAAGMISTNAAINDKGDYYCRYRVAITAEPNRYIEGNVKLIIVADPTPNISDPNEYDETAVAGTVMATFTSNMTNPVFELVPLSSSGTNPAPASVAYQAMEIVGNEVRWTGDVDATDMYDFTYRLQMVKCDEGCFKSDANFDVTYIGQTDYQYEVISDSANAGTFATNKDFIWAKHPTNGQFEKCQRIAGAPGSPSTCFYAPANPTSAADLTLNDFPDFAFDVIPTGDSCHIYEVGFNPGGMPDRALANGGIRHTMPKWSGSTSSYKGALYEFFGQDGVNTNEDFTFTLDCETEDININPVGQVAMFFSIAFSDGKSIAFGVRHRTAAGEPTPHQKYNYKRDTDTDWQSWVGTTADWSGNLIIDRVGTTVTVTMGSYNTSITVDSNAWITGLSCQLANSNGSARSDDWFGTFKNITIAAP